MPGGFGGGGVPSVKVPWQLTQAIQQENQIAQQQMNLANQIWQTGQERTAKYVDPVLGQFLNIMGLGGTPTASGGAQGLDVTKHSQAAFTSPLSSSMYQLPVWQTQQAFDATKKNIMNTVPPGPQQSALLTEASNQRMQGLGAESYKTVNNMLSALLGQNQWLQAGQAAESGLAGAGSTTAAAGGMAGSIAQIQAQNQALQLQAQSAGNTMLGSIFGSIGQLAAYGFGQWAGSPAGSAAITSFLG